MLAQILHNLPIGNYVKVLQLLLLLNTCGLRLKVLPFYDFILLCPFFIRMKFKIEMKREGNLKFGVHQCLAILKMVFRLSA